MNIVFTECKCLFVCFSSQSKSRRPMPKLVYNLMSGQELKRRLKECHLPVQGSRDQQVKRLQDFIHLYNSECDSLNPKSGERIWCVWKKETVLKAQQSAVTKLALMIDWVYLTCLFPIIVKELCGYFLPNDCILKCDEKMAMTG